MPHEAIEIFRRLDKDGDGFIDLLAEVQEGEGTLWMSDEQRERVRQNWRDANRLVEEFNITAANIGFFVDYVNSPNFIPEKLENRHIKTVGPIIIVTTVGAYVVTEALKTVSGGRHGGASVRALNEAIAQRLEAHGWKVTRGGMRGLGETRFPGAGPGVKGSNYADLTAVKGNKVLHVNTVSTYADGKTLKPDEARAARSIRIKIGPNEKFITIPKPSPRFQAGR